MANFAVRRNLRTDLGQLEGARGLPSVGSMDLVCLSHVPWAHAYQRPQNLMSRASKAFRVFFVEESVIADSAQQGLPARLDVTRLDNGVRIVRLRLAAGLVGQERNETRRVLLADLFRRYQIRQYILWYFTPAALAYTDHLSPWLTIYDCTNDILMAPDAAPRFRAREAELLRRSDLVFAGGRSLYEAKRQTHPHVYLFPSAVDREHFAQARSWAAEPADQGSIPRPRLGYHGTIDERLDLGLIESIARARPDWQLIFLGPRSKISPVTLPRQANIHYLGPKPYAELPAYLAGWDVAVLPLALSDATRYLSFTTPSEYLASGKPVVATPVQDISVEFGGLGLAQIASSAGGFVEAVLAALATPREQKSWLRRVDAFLAESSWDRTWHAMSTLLEREINLRQAPLLAQARIKHSHVGELLREELANLEAGPGNDAA